MRARTSKLGLRAIAIAIVVACIAAPSAGLAQSSGGAAAPSSDPATPPPPSCSVGSGGVGDASSCPPPGTYVNPFKGQSWGLSRIDMGIDLMPNRQEPVVAIGNAKILGSSMKSGWPGGGFIWYRLLDGDHAGNVIYVGEHLSSLLPAGTRVHAGQPIAVALPGSPWTEWGWATKYGNPRAYPCYKEGMQTNSGEEMARFLRSLGVKGAARGLAAGPNRPSGPRC